MTTRSIATLLAPQVLGFGLARSPSRASIFDPGKKIAEGGVPTGGPPPPPLAAELLEVTPFSAKVRWHTYQ